MRVLRPLRALERVTRPVDPETTAVMRLRWAELPEHVRTPAQTLGRNAVGCEGTHGVFPRCNLACTPCYHSRDANRVRVDGAHALAQVRAHGREPMSMSHGDFDYDYLRAVAVGSDGRRRLDRVSFAGHFDMFVFGRRGSETASDPRLAATQERLQACFYRMAHPEIGELVPGCVQHSVLDRAETAALRAVLPVPTRCAGA